MSDTIPPDDRAAGDSGHIDDHNDIADVLEVLQEATARLPGVNFTVSAAAPPSPGNNDIWFNTSGNALAVETWNSSVGAWIITSLSNIPKPSDYGLISETFELNSASGSVQVTNQYVYLLKLVIRQPEIISDIWCGITTPATGPVAGENWAGLISPAGRLLSSGQISSAGLTSQGPLPTALAAPQPVQPPSAWAALVFNCATPPFLLRGCPYPYMCNANLPVSAYQYAVNGTAATTLPATITPASNTEAAALALWGAAS